MGTKQVINNKNNNIYQLLSGENVSTCRLRENDREWLEWLREEAENDVDYFILLRTVRGRGARPLKGSWRLTPEIAQSVLFRVAEDIVERVGIQQGYSLPPGTGLEELDEKALVSGPEAAEIIGVTRAAVHRALAEGRLRGWMVGTNWVLSRADVLKYKEKREAASA